MWYSVLLTGNTFNEYSLFLENFKETNEIEIELESFVSFYERDKWSSLLNRFEEGNYTYGAELRSSKVNLINLDIIVNKGFLGVIENSKVKILINETDKNVYIDKYFERDFKKLFLKFKEIILSLYSSSKDIIYTDNAGKCCFYQFEKPKFKSISERKEYVNSLLDALNE